MTATEIRDLAVASASEYYDYLHYCPKKLPHRFS